jgi:hypothetical protein
MTILKQPVEYITEENYKLVFEEYINEYLNLIEKNKLKFFPETIKNEVKDYIKCKLFV